MTSKHGHSRGFTLFELIISLSLMGTILALIGTATSLYLDTLDRRRADSEEAQLARAILRQISNDLKSTVQYEGVDVEAGLEGLEGLGDLMSGDLEGMDLSGLDGMLGDDLSGLLGPPDNETENTTNIANDVGLPEAPGLYGNQYELMIDVSRLPRQEEYQVLYNPQNTAAIADIPSDVKTVTYYVRPETASATTQRVSGFSLENEFTAGLVRRQIDRATGRFALSSGNSIGLQSKDRLLAPEVQSIEFMYWDGYEWLPEWDSDVMEGIPIAVQVLLTMRSRAPHKSGGVVLAANSSITGPAQSIVSYRMVVRLPAGKINDVDNTDEGLESLGL